MDWDRYYDPPEENYPPCKHCGHDAEDHDSDGICSLCDENGCPGYEQGEWDNVPPGDYD